MYLEDITIEGFKSFSEKTDMSFQPGISVIIGNNGVGKSNILDAIVWALGESDLNRIRCYSDEELFFAGSKEYPPATCASVALTLKQSEKDKNSQTELCRQMDRDGTQRYFIGDKTCTPDEYQNKLASLNLSHALKTIIRQEQINDILLQNPGARLETICALLGIGSLDHFCGPVEKSVADLFSRYMSYLIPDAAVSLEVLSGTNKKGLEVVVTLPGNRVRRSHQLSGGEKAVTSLALKLAIFSQLRNPFFLLDEVEPSLDYTHHKSIQAFLRDVSAQTQLVMITHLRSTIELADTLHGVRTRRDGSSFMKFFFNMDKRLLRLYKCC